jgi:signal transduction histidine kinase
MTAAQLDHVFEPFRSTFSGGTGLGLSIVHRIVSDLGGGIEFESAPGTGTAVRVTLPAAAERASGEVPVDRYVKPLPTPSVA